jgi:membrane protein YqaA with SNARE-associated domain
MMDALPALAGLFLTALVAATVLPAQSEFVLAGLHLTGTHDRFVLVAVATVGNVLGSTIDWLLGRYLLHFQDRRWFPGKGRVLDRATRFYQRWGVWTLLLAWIPIIDDPLTLLAGIFRTSLWVFLPLVTLGKATRYLVIVMAA